MFHEESFFFFGTTALGKILTVGNMGKRKVIVVGWCNMCKRSGKSIDHLFLYCDVARELWASLISLFGVVGHA